MPVQPSSQLQRLIQRDRCNDPPPNASTALATESSVDSFDDPSDNSDNPDAVQTDENGDFSELVWSQVPQLERRGKEHVKGPPSWIYRYGWPVCDRFKKRNYWLCRYCHVSRQSGGIFNAKSTSSAATHLA
jgi:hypothetical protein